MATDRFLIAPLDSDSGLQRNVRPWLISDQAFTLLENAYVWRGRVKKRFGSRWLGNDQTLTRLRVLIGTTDGFGDFTGTVPLNAATNPIVTPAIGQIFSIGTALFTVNALGTPANLLREDGFVFPATFNTITGAVVISASTPSTPVFYYPALPVMGLITFENGNGVAELTIAFDTRFAYQYADGWERLSLENTAGAAFWTGSNSQFFWGTTYFGTDAFTPVFFVTNFNQLEPLNMRYLLNGVWFQFAPMVNATDTMYSARILVPFKNRLLAFNVWTGTPAPGNNYINRVLWSQANASPIATNAWRQDIPGMGGGLDAPISEAIITVEFIKDRLMVYFERSTWELVYTQNQALPFAWQQINTELGAESTFSVVPFDKVALGVGNVGIVACNSANVERIDDKIPDEVFDIHNEDGGVDRVYGIRDYYTELVYWTFPSTDSGTDFPFPNRVLTYNYKNNTWAIFHDSITAFGYFQSVTSILWSSTTVLWSDNVLWNGEVQPEFLQVIAGNQQGWTFICDSKINQNAPSLQITDITSLGNTVTITSINHNFRFGEYVFFSGITDYTVGGGYSLLNQGIYQIIDVPTSNQFSFIYDFPGTIAGLYAGGGVMSRVSKINILTKEYNFYAKQGRNAHVSKVDFMVDRTPSGQLQVNYYASTSATNLLTAAMGTGSLMGTGNLDTFAYPDIPYESDATRLWHPLYVMLDGEVCQLQLTMNDTQLRDPDIVESGFELHAFVIHSRPSNDRLQ